MSNNSETNQSHEATSTQSHEATSTQSHEATSTSEVLPKGLERQHDGRLKIDPRVKCHADDEDIDAPARNRPAPGFLPNQVIPPGPGQPLNPFDRTIEHHSDETTGGVNAAGKPIDRLAETSEPFRVSGAVPDIKRGLADADIPGSEPPNDGSAFGAGVFDT